MREIACRALLHPLLARFAGGYALIVGVVGVLLRGRVSNVRGDGAVVVLQGAGVAAGASAPICCGACGTGRGREGKAPVGH